MFNTNLIHKFLIFDFDADFKGLIGIDLLSPLACEIDLKNLLLKSETFSIPIKMNIESDFIIEPRCEKMFNFLCDYVDGYYIIEQKKGEPPFCHYYCKKWCNFFLRL